MKNIFLEGWNDFFCGKPSGRRKKYSLAKQAKNVFKKIILKNPSDRLFENTTTKLCWLEFEFWYILKVDFDFFMKGLRIFPVC